MNEDQFKELLAYVKIVAQNSAMLVAQGQLQRPLNGVEIGQCVESVQRVAEMIAGGLELGVLPPGDLTRPAQ